MEKKKKGKIVEYLQFILIVVAVVGIIGATIVCFWRIIVAPDWGQKLLAVSVLVPIWLGVFNMWKWFRSSSEFTEVSNKLDNLVKVMGEGITQTRDIEEQRRKDEREPIKESLKRKINIFISCWENGKDIYQKRILNGREFQKDLLDIGNTLKKQIGDNEKRLPQTIIIEANDIADDIIELAKRMRPRVILKENDEKDIRKYHEVLEEGDRIVRKAKELKEKLGAGGNE
jgi:multisubunit Na+/H+ antiporter MnhF subunit